jgi:hypothetical protein
MGICPRLLDLTRYSAATIAAVFAGVGFYGRSNMLQKLAVKAASLLATGKPVEGSWRRGAGTSRDYVLGSWPATGPMPVFFK